MKRTLHLCTECQDHLNTGDKIWGHPQDTDFCLTCDDTPAVEVEVDVIQDTSTDLNILIIQ